MNSIMLIFLAIALFVHNISGQCIPNQMALEKTAFTDLNSNYDIFRGPGLKVTSFSPVSASGITVQSDNLEVEGPVKVSGHLPFLGVVALDGSLLAIGEGVVAYNCGGNIGIDKQIDSERAVFEVSPIPGYN